MGECRLPRRLLDIDSRGNQANCIAAQVKQRTAAISRLDRRRKLEKRISSPIPARAETLPVVTCGLVGYGRRRHYRCTGGDRQRAGRCASAARRRRLRAANDTGASVPPIAKEETGFRILVRKQPCHLRQLLSPSGTMRFARCSTAIDARRRFTWSGLGFSAISRHRT